MATLFRDREHPQDYRVEEIDDDGGCEVAIFSGPDALKRARTFAEAYYGEGSSDPSDG